MSEIVPHWSYTETRNHLNDFLFRKNEEVTALVNNLSGGEKARLILAQISAKTPQLLILDEIHKQSGFRNQSSCHTGPAMLSRRSDNGFLFLKEIRVEEVCVAKGRS